MMLKSRKGTSLIEILIVMVVLIVGIMSVVTMFPSGFKVLKSSENQTVATRLAQRELERWKSMTSNLPDGILPINDATGAVWNEILPGGTNTNNIGLDNTFQSYTEYDGQVIRGNALAYRMVHGESTVIPVATFFETSNGTAYGARYSLAFSPIEVKRDTNGALDETYFSVKSGDMRRRTGDSDSPPPFLRPGDYAIDYNSSGGQHFSVAFPMEVGINERKYVLSYSYWADGPNGRELISVPAHVISYPEGSNVNNFGWVEGLRVLNLPDNYTFIEFEPESDRCARGFTEIGFNDVWSNIDPYQFKLADEILGTVAFNPLGNGIYEPTSEGLSPLIARINYRISDLRILREDRTIPAPNVDRNGVQSDTIPIKLSLRFLLNAGRPEIYNDGSNIDDRDDFWNVDPNEPQTPATFEGLIWNRHISLTRPIEPHSIMIIDLSTGLRVVAKDSNGNLISISHPDLNLIDYQLGIVNLPVVAHLIDYDARDKGAVELQGRHLRFFYRVDGDWSVQCHKAYSRYTRIYGGDPTYMTYVVKPNTNRLIFANCDLDKTVTVDYTYILNGIERRKVGENHKIDSDRTTGETCIDLNMPSGAELTRVNVTGTSFKARALWKDGRNWRYVDMDTSLLPK
ncbi:MAG: type II secretion system protein [Armatimonadota bacterium]